MASLPDPLPALLEPEAYPHAVSEVAFDVAAKVQSQGPVDVHGAGSTTI
jgi:hypothetical protein